MRAFSFRQKISTGHRQLWVDSCPSRLAEIGQKHSFNIGFCFARQIGSDSGWRYIASPEDLLVENSDASLNAPQAQ
jgi:hypothetical protein